MEWKGKTIRFYHKTKFGDGTLYLEWRPSKGMYSILKGSEMFLPDWTLKDAENFVNRGLYTFEILESE